MGVASDQVGATEEQQVGYGEIIVSDQAVAVGVTAVPTPLADSQSSWHVFELLAARFQFSSAVGINPNMLTWKEFDSKAMRKVEEGQDLVSVAENSATGDGALVRVFARILIKLH